MLCGDSNLSFREPDLRRNTAKGEHLKEVCEERLWKGDRDGKGGDAGESPQYAEGQQ